MPELIGGRSTLVELGPRLVHLVSGEDIIARVWRNVDNNELTLENVTQPNIVPARDKDGNVNPTAPPRMFLAPYRMFVKEDQRVTVNPASVAFIMELEDNLEKQFIQATTNIVVAGPGMMPGGIPNLR